MNTSITGRHFELTDTIKAYAEAAIHGLDKYNLDIISASTVISASEKNGVITSYSIHYTKLYEFFGESFPLSLFADFLVSREFFQLVASNFSYGCFPSSRLCPKEVEISSQVEKFSFFDQSRSNQKNRGKLSRTALGNRGLAKKRFPGKKEWRNNFV